METEVAIQRRQQTHSLLARPQKWGFLPTWAYWSRPPWSKRIRVSFWLTGMLSGALLYAGCSALGISTLFGVAALVPVGVLGFGLLEKLVRSKITAARLRELGEPE